MNKKQKLLLAKKRLELDIKKQEYVLMKDFLQVKNQYNPAKMATAIAFQFLGASDSELKDMSGLSIEQKVAVESRINQRKNLREMIFNIFTFVDLAFTSFSDKMLLRLIKDHEKFVDK
ncbi:MAG: hypothetical protein R3E32_16435 [Chitinophagales bacterium]